MGVPMGSNAFMETQYLEVIKGERAYLLNPGFVLFHTRKDVFTITLEITKERRERM